MIDFELVTVQIFDLIYMVQVYLHRWSKRTRYPFNNKFIFKKIILNDDFMNIEKLWRKCGGIYIMAGGVGQRQWLSQQLILPCGI